MKLIWKLITLFSTPLFRWPKATRQGPHQWPKATSPPQELEVGACRAPYLLVFNMGASLKSSLRKLNPALVVIFTVQPPSAVPHRPEIHCLWKEIG